MPRPKLISPQLTPRLSKGKISVAWAQLTHSKARLAVALSGIAFANVLIFMQLGFRALFTNGALALPETLAGDLYMVQPEARFIGFRGFERIRLVQSSAIAGVKRVAPLYVNAGNWAYSKDHISFEARVFAFNLEQTVFEDAALNQLLPKLREPDTLLFDQLSQDDLGPVVKDFQGRSPTQDPVYTLLNNRRMQVVGLFTMGSSFFVGEGNVLLSEAGYQQLFGPQALDKVSIGIIWLQPGADPAVVQRAIADQVPGVKILTKAELLARELKFQESSPAGPIFSFGAIMGFIIGIVIVYQVLYADINDHLAEYATLKAMGHSNWAVMGIVFQEAGFLGIMGFIPGLVTSHFMYQLLSNLTRLRLVMQPEVAVTVFLLTLVMCFASAIIASNKLRSADPADIFN
jgi:putative ABC transport system permease protein